MLFFKMASLSENESEAEYQDIGIKLPDLDDTQIIDEDQREIALYLDTRDGKVAGAETTPFLLPKRWTYETLRLCVEDYIQRNGLAGDGKRICRLYYKRAKGKSVVSLHGDGDIGALLKEYPLQYPSGKKKPNKIMYLAVEFEAKDDHGVRKSPRIQGHKHFDIFLHKYDDGKVSSTADTIHNVSSHSSLADIIQQIVLLESSATYLPQKGLYWLQKGSKQPVVLKTDKDLELCKREYNKGPIKLACEYLPSSPAVHLSTKSRKRKLDMDAANEKKTENELWNDIHVSLVRDLEKKGIMWRYNISHLKLWTDMVYEGSLSGIGEEPIWEDHLEFVRVPPKSRRSSGSPSSSILSCGSSSSSFGNNSFSASSSTTNTNMMEVLLLQNQQRMEMEAKRTDVFQTTVLALLSNQKGMVPFSNFQNESSSSKEITNNNNNINSQESKAMNEFTREDVVSILQKIGLECYVETFMENDIDGPMLEAITDPILGEGLLDNLGMHDKGHRQRLVTEIYRAKFSHK